MGKVKEFLKKYLLHIMTILFLIITMNNCSQSKTNKKYVKEINELTLEINTLKKETLKKEEFKLIIEINGYEVSENILNDFNDFARSKASPTERSRYYKDKKIDAQNKLEILK